jgi:KaiC/GvpD/RAD55 family RecA-like ATPase
MLTPEQLVRAARNARAGQFEPTGKAGGADELGRFIDGVASGRVYPVPFPWPLLSSLTQALIPGTVTLLCGDPGAGKTFFVLDCLRFWLDRKHDVSVFFVEKDRKFYLRRLLAQEEGNANLIDLDWIRQNADEVREAKERHRQTLDAMGSRMELEGAGQRATLRRIYSWAEEELKNGRRVLVVDPITAADAGESRWRTDDGFMVETQKLLTRYGASIILVTHPRKGNVTQKSGHDMSGGAAYFRFSDTTLWLNRLKKPKGVKIVGPHGYAKVKASTVIQIHKAREGKGTGGELVYSFGNGLHFAEHGVVVADLKEDEQEGLE